MKYNHKTRTYSFIKNSKFSLSGKLLVALVGLLYIIPIYYTEIYDLVVKEDVFFGIHLPVMFKIFITFCITVTVYDFFIKVIVTQIKNLISRLGKSKTDEKLIDAINELKEEVKESKQVKIDGVESKDAATVNITEAEADVIVMKSNIRKKTNSRKKSK